MHGIVLTNEGGGTTKTSKLKIPIPAKKWPAPKVPGHKVAG